MKTLIYSISWLLLCALCLFEEGCTQKNLNDDAPTTIADNVEVIFDWSKAPDTQASSMILYLFSEEHEVMNHWFNNRTGGFIKSYGGNTLLFAIATTTLTYTCCAISTHTKSLRFSPTMHRSS